MITWKKKLETIKSDKKKEKKKFESTRVSVIDKQFG
jgi:hypothetical protein